MIACREGSLCRLFYSIDNRGSDVNTRHGVDERDGMSIGVENKSQPQSLTYALDDSVKTLVYRRISLCFSSNLRI